MSPDKETIKVIPSSQQDEGLFEKQKKPKSPNPQKKPTTTTTNKKIIVTLKK
jgi:hypothetical protein